MSVIQLAAVNCWFLICWVICVVIDCIIKINGGYTKPSDAVAFTVGSTYVIVILYVLGEIHPGNEAKRFRIG